MSAGVDDGEPGNIVALETATETVGVAVQTASGVYAEFTLTGRRRHVETLMPALDHLLAQVGLEAQDVDTVAVDIGPGLFTGLRVGVAAAKGLALALGARVVAARSTDVLLGGAAAAGHRGPVLAVVDARRGEVFAALRDVGRGDGSGEDVLALGLASPGQLVAALRAAAETGARPGIVACGDGAARYAGLLESVPGLRCLTDVLVFPPPSALASMARGRSAGGDVVADAAALTPLYLRDADARRNFAQVGSG